MVSCSEIERKGSDLARLLAKAESSIWMTLKCETVQ